MLLTPAAKIRSIWLSHGLTVIPCVSWADPPWDYYFLGIIPHSTIAISTVGIKEQAHHVAGLLAMIEQIQPSNILCYGKMHIDPGIPYTEYPTYWQSKQATHP